MRQLVSSLLLVPVLSLGVVAGASAASCTAVWVQTAGGASYTLTSDRSLVCQSEAARLSGGGFMQRAGSCTVSSSGVLDELVDSAQYNVSGYAIQLTQQPVPCTDVTPSAPPASSASSADAAASTVAAVQESTSATKALHTAFLAGACVLCFGVGVFTGRQR